MSKWQGEYSGAGRTQPITSSPLCSLETQLLGKVFEACPQQQDLYIRRKNTQLVSILPLLPTSRHADKWWGLYIVLDLSITLTPCKGDFSLDPGKWQECHRRSFECFPFPTKRLFSKKCQFPMDADMDDSVCKIFAHFMLDKSSKVNMNVLARRSKHSALIEQEDSLFFCLRDLILPVCLNGLTLPVNLCHKRTLQHQEQLLIYK